MSAVEVGAKLVLDDHASASLHKMKEGFSKVGEKVTEVQHEMAGMARQALATAAGFQLSGVVDSLKEMGLEAFHAAAANEEQIKTLAGLVSMTDKTGMSYDELRKAGGELKDDLESIAIRAGATADGVIDAFSSMAERSTKTREALVDMTDKMAMASRALPGGMSALSGGFLQMEQGVVRPRNAIVQLIRTMGIMQGSSKEIAKGLSQMMMGGEASKAKAFELAEQAVGRMADKMKGAPLTFQETVNGLKVLRENIFEALGGPMVKAITPALENVKKYIIVHKEEIEHFAATMGEKVGTWAGQAAEKVEAGFKYLKDHADEIERAIVEGAKTLKEVITFILAHKEEIALAYGVNAARPLVGAVAGGARGAMAVGSVLAGGGGLGAAGVAGGGVVAGTALASAVALGAFVAAIGSVALAVNEYKGLLDDLEKDKAMEIAAVQAAMHKAAMMGDVAETARFRDALTMLNPRLAESANLAVTNAATWSNYNAELQKATQVIREGGLLGVDTAQYMADGFQRAAAAHSEGEMDFIAKMVAKGDVTDQALEALAITFGDRGQELVNRIQGFDKDLAAALQTAVTGAGRVEVGKITFGKPATPDAGKFVQNIGTINIKQDFRDQDPDRIALVFRRDLAKHANASTGARTSGVFGL